MSQSFISLSQHLVLLTRFGPKPNSLSLEQVAIGLTGLWAHCRNVTFYISQIIEILFMAFNSNWKCILDI